MQQNDAATIPTTAVVSVTPDQASQWLDQHNDHNRHLRPSRVEAYARDMAAGRWQFNGDPIRFSADGTLLDGQHRLHAVVRSGVTISLLVVWGLPRETQETMDIGAHRKMSDALTLRGESNSTHLAAIARRVLMYDNGSRVKSGHVVPTHAEMVAYIEANPDIRRSVEVSQRARNAGLPVAPSVVGSAYEICARNSKDDAEIFFVMKLIDAVGLEPADPARALLRRLQQAAATGRQMPPDDAFRYALIAWNAFRDRRTLTKVQAPKGGWTAKNFPVPK